MNEKKNSFDQLLQTIKKLRDPVSGCPWDLKQTHSSLRPYLLEETYETLEVLDQIQSDKDIRTNKTSHHLKEELGDVLLQILLHSQIANENEAFDFYDVAQSLNEKMIRRHPHVFSDQKLDTSDEVVKNWEKIKQSEGKKSEKKNVLSGVPSSLPALLKAFRTIEKVTQVGFQWPTMEGPLKKVEEELQELKEEILKREKNPASYPQRELENELGDLLFTIANLAHLLKVNPEDSLRGSLEKFHRRFNYVEDKITESGKRLEDCNLEEMDHYWEEVKTLEKSN